MYKLTHTSGERGIICSSHQDMSNLSLTAEKKIDDLLMKVKKKNVTSYKRF